MVGILMTVERGIILNLKIFGDFFAAGDIDALCAALEGLPVERETLLSAILKTDAASYIHGVENAELAELISG